MPAPFLDLAPFANVELQFGKACRRKLGFQFVAKFIAANVGNEHEREILQPRIVAAHEDGGILIRQVMHHIEQGRPRGEIDPPVPVGVNDPAIAVPERVKRFGAAYGGGRNHMIPMQAQRARMFAYQFRSLDTALVDRPVEIARNGRIPSGFAVAEQGERLHGSV